MRGRAAGVHGRAPCFSAWLAAVPAQPRLQLIDATDVRFKAGYLVANVERWPTTMGRKHKPIPVRVNATPSQRAVAGAACAICGAGSAGMP